MGGNARGEFYTIYTINGLLFAKNAKGLIGLLCIASGVLDDSTIWAKTLVEV